MLKNINWEIYLPSLSNKSPHEIVTIVNSLLISDFKEELEGWLNQQVKIKNLKSFRKYELGTKYITQKESFSILDLVCNEIYFKNNCAEIFNQDVGRWEKREFNDEVYLKTFRYRIDLPLDNPIVDINFENFKMIVSEPWFIEIDTLYMNSLKTTKNINVTFNLGFKYDNIIETEDLYPNFECDHDFKIFYQGYFNWLLMWECKICGFICFCSCFKEAIEGCRKGKVVIESVIRNFQGEYVQNIKTTPAVDIDEEYVSDERGFSLNDLNLTIDDIPYYDNACEVCRDKPSTHIYCHKMYARSEFERKYGAYAKKKFFEYKLLNEDISDEDLERRTNNLTRESLGFKKIGERFVSETELYRIIKSIFPNNNVVHHYKAKWLGRQEIDIFIPSLKLAIEYDGIQHFKPIKAWGGEEGLKKNIERDKIKEEKCKANNVILIRFNYKENDLLSENYVKSKLIKYGIDINS